ncbi:MAG: DegT/DnrJ/EryC1/StrS family aminotransferase [Planctomycetota bacterium]
MFHYLPLHKSPFYKEQHDGRNLPNADQYSNCLVRLPLYSELSTEDVHRIIRNVSLFFGKYRK